jgi:MFS transporter, DHA2 family, multidrug resistance protein
MSSVGISFVTTMLDRRTQAHQSTLGQHINGANPKLQGTLSSLSQSLQSNGLSAAAATQQAWARIQGLLMGQATTLACMDCFWLLGVAIRVMLPLVFLIRRAKAAGGMAVH